jgi:hypothetical protein
MTEPPHRPRLHTPWDPLHSSMPPTDDKPDSDRQVDPIADSEAMLGHHSDTDRAGPIEEAEFEPSSQDTPTQPPPKIITLDVIYSEITLGRKDSAGILRKLQDVYDQNLILSAAFIGHGERILTLEENVAAFTVMMRKAVEPKRDDTPEMAHLKQKVLVALSPLESVVPRPRTLDDEDRRRLLGEVTPNPPKSDPKPYGTSRRKPK